jgi:N-acetylmuramoyl-L-alanine amidase/Hemopexin
MPSENPVPTENLPWVRVAEGDAQDSNLSAAGVELRRRILAAPGLIWRQLDRGAQMDGLQVVARSRELLQSGPQAGDIVLRLIDGGSGLGSVVATPGVVSLQDLGVRGLHPDTLSSQGYVHVVEPAPVARRASEAFARGLTDSAGRVLEDLILLRLATPPPVITVQQPATSSPAAENLGDPPPNMTDAVNQCVANVQNLRNTLADAASPSRISRLNIANETHVSVDANPYFSLGQQQLEAVVRAAASATQAPETLLALWAKEGSVRMVTSPSTVTNASSADNARSLFRSNVYYVDLGSDHFVITRYDPVRQDNVWDDRDSIAPSHEKHFQDRVQELVKSGILSEDISAAINAELTVSASAPFTVTPSTRFYALSLLLMDALFTSFQRNIFSQLASLSEPLNYVQWNIGTAKFRKFLASAEKHRQEKAYKSAGGDPISIEQWALHTVPKNNEWRAPRVNAIRFMYYSDCYRPIFTTTMGLIRPAAASPSPGAPQSEFQERTSLRRSPAEDTPSLPKGSACAYFFKGKQYVRYNTATDAVDFAPKDIATSWPHLPANFQNNIDAIVNWGNGHAYFFKGSRCLRYNIATDRLDSGPEDIATLLPQLTGDFRSKIDAAVNWGNGYVYFFNGAKYLRFNLAVNVVDVAPTAIAANWSSLPKEPLDFTKNLDAVVNWADGRAYFFKEDQYVRYDIKSDQVDWGPKKIATYWSALPAAFRSNIRATVNWTFPCDLADLMTAAGLTVNPVADWKTRKRPGSFTPIGIMMHHTAGRSSLDAIINGRTTPTPLAGPLANFHIDKSGLVNVVSVGPANHAGPGAQQVLNEVSQGVVPAGTAGARGLADGPGGNSFFYGFENENLGDGVDPWPEVQLDAMARAAAALCQVHCWNENRVIAHKEWTSRKPDPTFNMNDFRTRVARFF